MWSKTSIGNQQKKKYRPKALNDSKDFIENSNDVDDIYKTIDKFKWKT